MRLEKKTQKRLAKMESQVPGSYSGSMLSAALKLAEQGWNVFPLVPRGKEPLFPKAHKRGIQCHGECGKDGHGAWDGTTDPERIRRWWSKHPTANIGANMGEDRIAFDRDIQHGAVDLASFPETTSHISGRGNGNRHLIYRVDPQSAASTLKSGTGVLGDGWDVRAGRGSYIVMPPSVHPDTDGRYYRDPASPDYEHVLQDDELQEIFNEAGVPVPAVTKGAAKGLQLVKPGTTNRSMLADLLANPPKRGQGKTNEWIAKVAGHYAKQYHGKEDLYRVHCEQAMALVDSTYEDFEKTLDSIWDTEVSAHPERDVNRENGYLIGTGTKLLCQVAIRTETGAVLEIEEWGNFDILCRGIAIDDVDKRTYWVSLMFDGKEIETTVDYRVLSDSKRLLGWLMSYGASFSQPANSVPPINPGVRILQYLNSQDPQRVNITGHLGWFPGVGFVTHDGVITADGDQGRGPGVVASPELKRNKTAQFTYGFQGTWEEAQGVLREVLTFQDENVTSVFGAWWAACLLKPLIQGRTSVFPFFGVEASSESGKTNGFFEQMIQLNGNTQGQTVPTRAAMRDYAAANSSGIVWADDLDSLEQFGELLRASTSGGTASKFNVDENALTSTKIVSPILVTGEALGLYTQKALRDRSVQIEVPSPVHRQSLHGNYAQWEDVKDLQSKYPKDKDGMAVLAGWYVQASLAVADKVEAYLREAKKRGTGRLGDKFAVLRAGAALLDALVGHEDPFSGTGDHARRVERWITEQEADGDLEKDNTVTQVLIPWVLETYGLVDSPADVDDPRLGLTAPVFVREESATLDDPGGKQVWVRPRALAMAWAKYKNHRIDDRTESESAVRQQLTSMGARTKVFKVSGRSVRYLGLPPEYAARVLERWM